MKSSFSLLSLSGTKNDWCFTCEFERLVWMVKQGKSPISPVEILSHINLGHGKEEDAHEFLRSLFLSTLTLPVYFVGSWWYLINKHLCRYAIDAMQSVCLMEAGNSVTSPIIENTTLIQLSFGGYLKSKVPAWLCSCVVYVIFCLRYKMLWYLSLDWASYSI